jgi:hypothetical protein
LETVDHAEESATRIATELGFGEEEVMQISMAVREARSTQSCTATNMPPTKK